MKTKDIAVAVALMAIAAAVWILYPTATVADSYSGRLSDARFVEARDVLVDYAKRNRARGIVALKSHDARMGVLLYCDTAQMMRLVSLADGVTYLSVDEGAELRAPEVAALTRQVADMLGKEYAPSFASRRMEHNAVEAFFLKWRDGFDEERTCL